MKRPVLLPPAPVKEQTPEYVLHIEQNRFIQKFRKQRIISDLEKLATGSTPLTRNLAKHLYSTKDAELYRKIASNPKATADTLISLNEHLKLMETTKQPNLGWIASPLILNHNTPELVVLSLLERYPELLQQIVSIKSNIPETVMFQSLNAPEDANLMSLLLSRKDLTDDVMLKAVKLDLPLKVLNKVAAEFVLRGIANKSASFQYEWVRLSYLEGNEHNIFNDYAPVLLQEAKYEVAEKLFIAVDTNIIPANTIDSILRNKFQNKS